MKFWIGISPGTDGILVLGTTGESSTMSHEEDDAVCRFTIDRVAGRVSVIAGSGSNSTETQLEKSKKYAAMGADALLCITPYYIKANAEGMYRHFADVADAVDVPVILYNVPGAPVVPFRWRRWLVWPGIPIYAASKKPAAIFLTR